MVNNFLDTYDGVMVMTDDQWADCAMVDGIDVKIGFSFLEIQIHTLTTVLMSTIGQQSQLFISSMSTTVN